MYIEYWNLKEKLSMQTAMEVLTDKLNSTKEDLTNQIKAKEEKSRSLEEQQLKQSKRIESLKEELKGAMELVH
ncbi:MAG: hypothetical protein HQL12_06925 [Candidatus Omnitrophica bacterium]|nr:hypothetical protein [Candidatus Omnitrophota bacterium]